MTDHPDELTQALNAFGRARRAIEEAEMRLFRLVETMFAVISQEARARARDREPVQGQIPPITSAPGFDGRARGSGDDDPFPCDTEGK